jgi:hypothetical protein
MNKLLFLRLNKYADFREGVDDPKGLFDLRWGITGIMPAAPAPAAAKVNPVEAPVERNLIVETVDDLVQTLRSQNITLFLGPGASYSNAPARACDIARELLKSVQIIPKDESLLPPIDIAGMYYSVKNSDRRLQTKVVDLMRDFPQSISPTQESVARLLKLMSQRPQGRIRGKRRQLIVSTNLDLMTERALLRAGLPFTRIVQHRSAEQISINEYRDIKLAEPKVLELPGLQAPIRVNLDDLEALDDQITTYGETIYSSKEKQGAENPLHTLPLQNLTEPILYKFLGSQDVENSCVLSTAHHFGFARNVLRKSCIPAQVTEIIGNSTLLFIGLSFLDPDFRLTYYSLLTSALDDINRDERGYALQLPPERHEGDTYRQMERGLWDDIKDFGMQKLGIKTIEEQNDVFLNDLITAVQRDLGI